MPDYTVTWLIDLEADDPVDAARKAKAIQQDPASTANKFDVTSGDDGTQTAVDLDQADGIVSENEDD